MPCILSVMQTDSYHLMGCMLSAASCNKWWAEEILQTKDYAAEQAPISANLEKIMYSILPYLMGERSPHNDPDARGVFYRNVHGHYKSRYDTGRVWKELHLDFVILWKLQESLGIKIERTKICGGGAKSPLVEKNHCKCDES